MQDLPPLGESGSKIPHFIPEPKKCSEVTKIPDGINKPCLKPTLNEIKNIINNQNFLFEYPKKDEPVNSCMYVYKEKKLI